MQSGWPNLVQDVHIKLFATRKDELSVQDGCIPWGTEWPFPKQAMLRELHEAHPGETRMERLARMFLW